MILEKVIYKLSGIFLNLKEPDSFYNELSDAMLIIVQEEALETALLIEKYLERKKNDNSI